MGLPPECCAALSDLLWPAPLPRSGGLNSEVYDAGLVGREITPDDDGGRQSTTEGVLPIEGRIESLREGMELEMENKSCSLLQGDYQGVGE